VGTTTRFTPGRLICSKARSHLVQLNQKLSAKPRDERSGSGLVLGASVASVTHQVVRLNRGHLDLETARGTDESERTSVLHESVEDRGGSHWGGSQQFDEDLHGDLKRVHRGLHGEMELQGMQQLGQNQGNPQLNGHQFGACSPPNVQPQFAFEQLEGHLDIPASGIQLGDLLHGEVSGTQHIGQIAIADAIGGEADQAHRMGGSVGTVLAQPDDGIEQPTAIIIGEDFTEVIAHVVLEARDPEVALSGQVVEPRKAEIAQIREDETARSYLLEQEKKARVAGGQHISAKLHAYPGLRSQIEEARQFARQQMRIAVGQVAQV